jgi:hypothetical protein
MPEGILHQIPATPGVPANRPEHEVAESASGKATGLERRANGRLSRIFFFESEPLGMRQRLMAHDVPD